MHTDRIRKGEPPMKKKGLSTMIVGKFKSIQSSYFCDGSFSGAQCGRDRYRCIHEITNNSIFENSSEYTHTIIQQMTRI